MSYLNNENTMAKPTKSTFNIFIRSLIFSIVSFILITLSSIIISCTLIIPKKYLRYRHAVIRTCIRGYMLALKYICDIDVKIEGLENIPKDRNGIALCKHQSTWETFYLPLLFQNPAPIAKKELMYIPFFGWALAAADSIAIDRSKKSTAQQQILVEGKRILDDGRWIMAFPEGTRTPFGTVGQYKLGGARLAAATGYPVIPVAHDAGRYWPRRKFMKYPGTIHLVIGPAIESKGRSAEEILELAKNWIETTMTRITGLVDKPTR